MAHQQTLGLEERCATVHSNNDVILSHVDYVKSQNRLQLELCSDHTGGGGVYNTFSGTLTCF